MHGLASTSTSTSNRDAMIEDFLNAAKGGDVATMQRLLQQDVDAVDVAFAGSQYQRCVQVSLRSGRHQPFPDYYTEPAVSVQDVAVPKLAQQLARECL